MKKLFLLILVIYSAGSVAAQNIKDSADGRFHDDLLDHLVGTWKVNAVAHDFHSTAIINVEWVLNHQFLFLHFMGIDTIPWWHMPMEYQEFIGYNHAKKRYNFHGMSIEGDTDTSEGFGYAYRNGNEFKIVAKMNADTSLIQRLTWQPTSRTWSVKSTGVFNGKEDPEVFIEMKLEAVKSSSGN
jgi:hypothetical protein